MQIRKVKYRNGKVTVAAEENGPDGESLRQVRRCRKRRSQEP